MDKRDILVRLLGEETVSKMTDRASGGLDRFGDKLEATEKDAKNLDQQIVEVEGNLKTLATAFSRTQDAADRVDLTKAMRQQQAELRKLTKARDLLPDMDKAGEEAAKGFVASLVTRIGPLLARAPGGPAGLAIGGALAVGIVPMLGAAVGGAVLGGVGVGGVIGGITLASKDARVQAAGQALGEAIMADLDDAASTFVQPTIDAIGIIRAAWTDVSGDVQAVFGAVSRYVEPLARGVADSVREIVPGVREAAEAAGPIVREIGEGLPRIGRAISDVLSDISGHADEGASAMRALFGGIEQVIRFGGGVIAVLSDIYRGILTVSDVATTIADEVWGWIPGIGDLIGEGKAHIGELKAAMDEAGQSGEQAGQKGGDGLRRIAEGASAAATPVQTLSDQLRDMAGINISAEQASIRLTGAIAAATAAGKSNTDGIGINNAKQAENRARLVELAQATNAASAAIMEQTGSQALASEESQRGRTAFLKAAEAMGVGTGKAKELADKLFAIPESRGVKVTANTQPAMTAVNNLIARINNMKARIGVGAYGSGAFGGSKGTGFGYSPGYSEGGLHVGPGTGTSDDIVARVSAGEYTLRAAAVKAIGVDTLDALNQADRRPVATGRAGVGAAPAGVSAVDLARLMEQAMTRAMSRATLVLDDRTGRTATIIARGV